MIPPHQQAITEAATETLKLLGLDANWLSAKLTREQLTQVCAAAPPATPKKRKSEYGRERNGEGEQEIE